MFLNLAILGFLFFSFGREFAGNWEIQKEIRDLEIRAENLKTEHLEIERLVSLSQTEAFLEREARLKLGLNKPGEKVVIIDGDQFGVPPIVSAIEGNEIKNDPFLEPAVSNSSPIVVANPLKWWYYFFDAQKFSFLKLKHYGK